MTRGFLIALLALAALTVGGLYFRHARHRPSTTRILMLDGTPGVGLTVEEAQVLNLLIVDELETRGDLAVTPLPVLPQPFHPETAVLVLRPRPSREGTNLHLDLEWAEMGPGREGAWHHATPPAQAPARAIRAALGALPLDLTAPNPDLLPLGPNALWALVTAERATFTNTGLDEALAQATSLANDEPRCAAIQTALAHLGTNHLRQKPQGVDGQADQALQAADRALKLEPGYPRALRYASRLLADGGRQDDALTRTEDALRLHPHALPLLFAVDYAARTGGLLDLALAARTRIQSLWSGASVPPPTGFAYLYAGRVQDFQASFPTPQSGAPDGFVAFNRGYAALLLGKPEEAAPLFQIAEQDTETEAQFRALAAVLRFQIQGRAADARTALETLEHSRIGLQVPDGEFTFTMAEAAAYLGEAGLAMDLAQQASAQGFLCEDWYRNSPFMAGLQPLPRWQSILQHVDARRARLAQRHSPADFGL